MTDTINILFFGDIVGRPGRRAVADFMENNPLNIFDKDSDFIIANVENASHGFGLTEKNHKELAEMGIDCFTTGNHIWDKKDIYAFIDNSERLVRPLNYPDEVPGVGARLFEKNNVKIVVISLLGKVFMDVVHSPWAIIAKEIEKWKKITPIIIIDFHAEATAEKFCFGKYCEALGVSAVLGTHTHVQTADDQIMNGKMAYITDAGFCGANDGIIGMRYEESLKRLLTGLPERFEVADGSTTQVNAVYLTLNVSDGSACNIKRIQYEKMFSEEK